MKWIRNTPTATHEWHDLRLQIAGTKLQGFLDGKPYLEHTLPEPVFGRVGLWSKADSYVYFSDLWCIPRCRTERNSGAAVRVFAPASRKPRAFRSGATVCASGYFAAAGSVEGLPYAETASAVGFVCATLGGP